jgi:hypothetical protein
MLCAGQGSCVAFNPLAGLHRDIYHPVWQVQTGVAFILAADWPAPSLPTLVSTDNGYLHVRRFDMRSMLHISGIILLPR